MFLRFYLFFAIFCYLFLGLFILVTVSTPPYLENKVVPGVLWPELCTMTSDFDTNGQELSPGGYTNHDGKALR